MADSTFEIGIQISGEDKAARAFENLKLRELEAKQEASKLAAELRNLQKSGTASAAEIEKTSRALIRAKQEARGYAQQARAVEAAVTRSTRAQAAQTAQLGAQSVQLAGLGGKWGQIAGAMGNVGTVAGTLAPQMGRLGSAFGSVGTATSALTGAMGPWGAALGAAVSVVGIAAAAYQLFADDTDDLAEAHANAAKETRNLINELRQQQQLAAIVSGRASVSDIEASVKHARDLRDVIEGELEKARELLEQRIATNRQAASFSEMARTSEAVQESRRQVDSLVISLANAERGYQSLVEAQTTAAQRELRLGAEDDAFEQGEKSEDEADRKRRARRTARAREIRDATAEELRIFRESRAEMVRLELDSHQSQAAALREFLKARREMQRAETVWWSQELAERRRIEQESNRIVNEAIRAEEEADRSARMKMLEEERAERARINAAEAKARAEALAEQQKADADALQKQRELAAITGAMWESMGSTVTSAAGEMYKFLISGAEGGEDAFLALLDSFLEATSVEYTIKALAEVANAVAAAARQDYASAAQHGVAAGLAAGVAAATGLASAAISVPSAGAEGGPARVGAGEGGAGGGATTINTTIQVYSPNAVYTKQEQGALIAGMVREAERVRPGSASI